MKEKTFDTKNLINGLALGISKPGFSSADDFSTTITQLLDVNSIHCESALDIIDSINKKLKCLASNSDPLESIRLSAFVEDMEKISLLSKKIDPQYLTVGSIEKSSNFITTWFESRGLELGPSKLRVVEFFPKPFDTAGFAAMAYTSDDSKDHGIEPGVALLKSKVSPLLSIFYLAHEAVHVALGKIEAPYLACGIEEGIADYVACCIVSELFGEKLVSDLIVNLRFRTGGGSIRQLYRESLVRTFSIVAILGERFLFDKLRYCNKNGRKSIRALEDPNLIEQERNSIHQVEKLPKFVSSVLSRSFVYNISLDDYVICKELRIGEKNTSAAKRLNISKELIEETLASINNKLFFCVSSNGKVLRNECPMLCKSGQLRYNPATYSVLPSKS